MSTTELARREERAQDGIIQFAEELQAIRDGNLYPGAKQKPDAWKSYCKEWWGMGKNTVDEMIRARSVLMRFMHDAVVHGELPSVAAQAQGIRHAETAVESIEERLGLSVEAMSQADLGAFEELLLAEVESWDGAG